MVFVATEITIKKLFFFYFSVLFLSRSLVLLRFAASIHFLAFYTRSHSLCHGMVWQCHSALSISFIQQTFKIECHRVSMDDIAQNNHHHHRRHLCIKTKTQQNIKQKFTFSNYFVIAFYYSLTFIIDNSFPT